MKLKKLSKACTNTSEHEVIIDGEIIEVQLPRLPNALPHHRIAQIKTLSKSYDGESYCFLYLLLLSDGWHIGANKVRSPFWMVNSVEFKWEIAPEYLKCLKRIKERVLQTYEIEQSIDLGSVMALSLTNKEG